MWLPSRGWTGVLQDVLLVPQYVLLGPWSRDDVVVDLEIGIRPSAGLTATFGAVMSESASTTVGAWRAGVSVVQRSPEVRDGQPVVQLGISTGTYVVARLAVGVRVLHDPLYMLCMGLGSHGSSFIDYYFTASCLGRVDEGGGDGAE